MPAYPHRIPLFIDGECVYIYLYGDEHNKRCETADGYTILQEDNIWYYAEKDDDGILKASQYKISATLTEEKSKFLSGIPRHLKSEFKNTSKAKSYIPFQTSKKSSALGNRRVLIILMEYKDIKFTRTQADFNALFNMQGYRIDGAKGSVYDYYNDVSYGKLQLTCDVLGPFEAKNERAYYGHNDRDGDDENPFALFQEAMEYAVQHIQLNEYDADNDGYIDNVHVVFAGHGEEAGASSDAIWSHEMSFRQSLQFQDMLVDRYSCAPELRGNSGDGISRIGPHCHEIGHALGAMDYYDTDYEDGGHFEGTGIWDIMASGSWNENGIVPADFNPYVKMADFGWIDIPELPKGEINILPSSETESGYYRIQCSPNEYYLIENRTTSGWGEGLPGSGLLIFHIHPNIASSGNKINTSYPQKCYPVCASSTFKRPTSSVESYGSINSSGCTFPGSSAKTEFSDVSIPIAFSWNGSQTHISLQNIHQNSDGSIFLNNKSSSATSVNGLILFQEGFESPVNYVPVTDEGITEWSQYTIAEDKVLKGTVPAHNGFGYYRLRPNKSANGYQQSTFTIQTQKAKEEREALLTFYYYGSSFRSEENLLGISYACDGNEWSDTTWIQNNKAGWNNFMLNMNPAKSYRLKITGCASYGQAIYLDDIEIMQNETNNIIRQRQVLSENETKIFDMLGRKREMFQKGINIVLYPDGVKRKVNVR